VNSQTYPADATTIGSILLDNFITTIYNDLQRDSMFSQMLRLDKCPYYYFKPEGFEEETNSCHRHLGLTTSSKNLEDFRFLYDEKLSIFVMTNCENDVTPTKSTGL
jgi:hypothetical protein